jgi:DNA-binding NarL/FixJ family response regulator
VPVDISNETSQITVALGRFDDLLARGLRGLVEDDGRLELVASDVPPAQLTAVLRARGPRVAILDAASLLSPAEVRSLTARHPQTHLLVLADAPSGLECSQLLAFGAAACLAKATQARDVLNAIHLASRGLQLVPRSGYGAPAGSGLLTPREADVLARLHQRSSNAQIAADLHISIETVRTHARHIYRKLGVCSRRELLAPLVEAPAPVSGRLAAVAPVEPL